MGFDYSDGQAIEETILALLRAAPDLRSEAAIAVAEQEKHWPVRYHLAPERANLIRHLDFSGLDVLELGAGMGAVSRFIGERAGSFLAVEGSERRCACLTERLRDLEGVATRCSRIEELRLDRRFDVVCVFGVLEYAECYLVPPADFPGDPFDFFLSHAASFLKPEGVLLVAIENRFGLKYWSGAGEDHSGGLFDGIVGYPPTPSARTFARRELSERIARAGLETAAEYYPFPDYKLPFSVLSAELVARDPDLSADLACYREFSDHLRPRSVLFPDYMALTQVARAGLFAEFSNSFLTMSCRGGASPVLECLTRQGDETATPRREVAWHYSPMRRQPTLTVFYAAAGEGLTVEKRALDAGDAPVARGETLTFADGRMRVQWSPGVVGGVAVGERLRYRLLRQIYFGQEAAFREELRAFLEWILKRFPSGRRDLVAGEAIDALITNAVLPPGGVPEPYELFDREWTLAEPQHLGWFVLRNVLALYNDLSAFNRSLGFKSLGELYAELCRAFRIEPDVDSDVRLEARFQSLVSRRSRKSLMADLRSALERPFQHPQLPPRNPDFLHRWVQEVQKLEEERSNLHQAVTSQERVIGVQTDSVAAFERTVSSLQEANRVQEQTIASQNDVISRQQRTIDGLQETVIAQQRALTAQSEAFRERERQSAASTDEVARLRAASEELRRQLAVYENELAALRNEHDEHERLSVERTSALAAREIAYAALDRERQQLLAVLGSRRHHLIERWYGWLTRQPWLFAPVKLVWRGLLGLTGRR